MNLRRISIITAVRYDDTKKYIDKVKILREPSNTPGNDLIEKRPIIFLKIYNGSLYTTALKDTTCAGNPTDLVEIVRVDDEDFIRIDSLKERNDWLGNIPEF